MSSTRQRQSQRQPVLVPGSTDVPGAGLILFDDGATPATCFWERLPLRRSPTPIRRRGHSPVTSMEGNADARR